MNWCLIKSIAIPNFSFSFSWSDNSVVINNCQKAGIILRSSECFEIQYGKIKFIGTLLKYSSRYIAIVEKFTDKILYTSKKIYLVESPLSKEEEKNKEEKKGRRNWRDFKRLEFSDGLILELNWDLMKAGHWYFTEDEDGSLKFFAAGNLRVLYPIEDCIANVYGILEGLKTRILVGIS